MPRIFLYGQLTSEPVYWCTCRTWIQRSWQSRFLAGNIFTWCICFWLLLKIRSGWLISAIQAQQRNVTSRAKGTSWGEDWDEMPMEKAYRHRANGIVHWDVSYSRRKVTRQRWKFFDHRTSHHCPFTWVTGDLVNKSTKLYLCNESSKSPLVGMPLFQYKSALASV